MIIPDSRKNYNTESQSCGLKVKELLIPRLECLSATIEAQTTPLSLQEFKLHTIASFFSFQQDLRHLEEEANLNWVEHQQGYSYSEIFKKKNLEALLLKVSASSQMAVHSHNGSLNVGICLKGVLLERVFFKKQEKISLILEQGVTTTDRFESHQLVAASLYEPVLVLSLYSNARPE